jgi:hypothetical protein
MGSFFLLSRVMDWRRGRAPADDQARRMSLRDRGWFRSFDPLAQCVGKQLPQGGTVQADRGERRVCEAVQVRVVEADD